MKYCVSGRQGRAVLAKADEIEMEYKDRERLLDYTTQFNDKAFIVKIPKEEENIDWLVLKALAEKFSDFYIALGDLNRVNELKTYGLKYYWSYPIVTWEELDAIVELEPDYLFLGAPLSFSLEKVKIRYNIPIRLCVNLAYNAYIPRKNGITGSWIRPEDIEVYEQWVDSIVFSTDDLGKESTLLDIYKFNKVWPGNLNLLITNLNYNIDNRAIPEEFGKIRANCGQRCKEKQNCHFCDIAFDFATDIRKKHYRDKKKELT